MKPPNLIRSSTMLLLATFLFPSGTNDQGTIAAIQQALLLSTRHTPRPTNSLITVADLFAFPENPLISEDLATIIHPTICLHIITMILTACISIIQPIMPR